MPETAITNQLPPRTTASNHWPRKWSTIGGHDALPSTINDANLIDNSSKTNGNHRQSSSLFRKSSTISRTNDPPIISDENSSSLKKSRSLMNVIRSKLNSPGVLRRFRSKSRESAKQIATEPNSHISKDEHEVRRKKSLSIPKSNDEPRKSRKRDPSPMRRLANRIAQLTTSSEGKTRHRKSKSPSKSVTIDSHEETKQTPSPLYNKDKVEHLNSCYDEILAKMYDNPTPKRSTASTIQPSNDYSDRSNFNNGDSQQNRSLSTISINGSLLSNDYLNNSQRLHLPNDPLLQARKQSNIKLNCMLSGYGSTKKSFVNHEKLFGENDLFKFHHYHDVGTRKYDWNFTNNNNRILTNMKTRPISKSIDSFRRTNTNETAARARLDRINIGVKDSTDYPSVELENHLLHADEDAPVTLPYDNELFIREDSDLIISEEQQYPSPDRKTFVSSYENKRLSNEETSEEQDEEFERNFLRAVDRALGIANKDQNKSTQPLGDVSTRTDESNLNLIQMTERALSSMNNSALFTNDDQKNEQTNNEHPMNDTELLDSTKEHHIYDMEVPNTDLLDRSDEHLVNDTESLSAALVDRADNLPINKTELPSAELLHNTDEHPVNDTELSNAELSHSANEHLIIDTESPSAALVDRTDKQLINDAELSSAELLHSANEHLIDDTESPSAALIDRTDEHPINDTELSGAALVDRTDKQPINDTELSSAESLHSTDEHVINDRESSSAELLDRTDKHPINDTELPNAELLNRIDVPHMNDTESPSAVLVNRTDEQLVNDAELPGVALVDRTDKQLINDTELSSAELLHSTDEHVINDTESPSAALVDRIDEFFANDTEFSFANLVGGTDEHLTNNTESGLLDRTDEHFDIEQSSSIHNNETVNENREEKKEIINDDSVDENIKSVLDDLIRKIEDLLVEDPKNGQVFLNKLDDEEKTIKSKADSYNKVLQSEDNRLTEDVCTDINAVIGEVNLLLRGKLKQFRGLCQANVTKSRTASGEPIPLDSDLEGFWDITYPLIDKVKEKFAKLDARKSKQWAPIEEYDPNDINNRPRVIGNRLKQLQPQQNKSSKIPITKSTNDDLKKLIQERRKAAASTTNQNHDIEIFVAPK